MAATNFTPIILYHTTTASAAPTAGNLNNGELAINITDGKLFYKDNGGTVQVIATKGTGTIGGSLRGPGLCDRGQKPAPHLPLDGAHVLPDSPTRKAVSLESLRGGIVACRRCPRLVRWRGIS